MGNMEQLPLDDDMIERATSTLNDLVGHQVKRGVTNPYIDVDDYVKRLCRLYAEQTLNAAFHGVTKMQTWTAEQVYERGQSALDRFVSGGPAKCDEAEKYGFKPGGVTASSEYIADQAEAAVNRTLRRQQSKAQHPSSGAA